MHDARDPDDPFVRAVEHAVACDDGLAMRRIGAFGKPSATPGQIGETFGRVDDPRGDRLGRLRRITRDEIVDALAGQPARAPSTLRFPRGHGVADISHRERATVGDVVLSRRQFLTQVQAVDQLLDVDLLGKCPHQVENLRFRKGHRSHAVILLARSGQTRA